jgi:hypothetical protein
MNSFDKLLMVSEGFVVYFGEPKASLEYLTKLDLTCPPGYNAADHWMDLLVTDTAVEQERLEELEQLGPGEMRKRRGDQANKQASPRLLLQEAWDSERVAQEMDQALVTNETALNNNDVSDPIQDKDKYPSGWWTQYSILTSRALKNSQSAIFTPINLIKSLFIGIVVGLLFFQIPFTESRVNDIRGYYFLTMTFWVFDSM